MKTITLIVALTLTCSFSIAQNFPELVQYEFTTEKSYETEKSKVLMCANYLFNNPTDNAEINRQIAIQYIMKWMEGTPQYTFEIGEPAMDLTKGSDKLFGLYLAGMAKVVLENEGDKLSNEQIHSKTEEILVNYCSDEKNNIKPSKKIKKMMKSEK